MTLDWLLIGLMLGAVAISHLVETSRSSLIIAGAKIRNRIPINKAFRTLQRPSRRVTVQFAYKSRIDSVRKRVQWGPRTDGQSNNCELFYVSCLLTIQSCFPFSP